MVLDNHWAEAALVGTALLYLIYDWYGEHSLQVNTSLGITAIKFDFLALLLYFCLIYFSSDQSQYFALFMALRAARGIALNVILIRRESPFAPRLKSYNVSSGLMVFLFGLMFAIDEALKFSQVQRLTISFGLWLFAYGAAIASERIFRNSPQRRLLTNTPIPRTKTTPSRVDTDSKSISTEASRSDKRKEVVETRSTARFYDASSSAFEHDFYGTNADPAIALDVEHVRQLMRMNVTPDTLALEVGCGTGYWLRQMSEELGVRAVGIDISENMLSAAKQAGSSLLAAAEASELPFADEIFDVVASPFNALDHTQNYSRAFAEIRRVLKVGGVALLMLDNRQRFISRYWHVNSPRIISQDSDPRENEMWLHRVDGVEVAVFSHLYTSTEVHELLPGFSTKIVGVGLLTPLIPHELRRHHPNAVTKALKMVGPLERRLAQFLPRFSAHLFVIARKV
jgi:ubiquinone/menaquinone biosynthesis C-methylase UbiE